MLLTKRFPIKPTANIIRTNDLVNLFVIYLYNELGTVCE